MRRERAQKYEFDSPYINAPVWPWSAAGWSLATMFVVLFLLARIYG
jgi:hypothetical protein